MQMPRYIAQMKLHFGIIVRCGSVTQFYRRMFVYLFVLCCVVWVVLRCVVCFVCLCCLFVLFLSLFLQVSVWVAKLPDSETGAHTNIVVDNLVSMNSRADGFNVHGAVRNLTLKNSHLENSGDDCIGEFVFLLDLIYLVGVLVAP